MVSVASTEMTKLRVILSFVETSLYVRDVSISRNVCTFSILPIYFHGVIIPSAQRLPEHLPSNQAPQYINFPAFSVYYETLCPALSASIKVPTQI